MADLLIPDTDPSTTITIHDLLHPTFPIPDTDPTTTITIYDLPPSTPSHSHPSTISLPLSSPSLPSSPAPSSSFSHYSPDRSSESYVLLPHAPYQPIPRSWVGFADDTPTTPPSPTTPTAPTDGISPPSTASPASLTDPTSPTDSTSPTDPNSPNSPTPPTTPNPPTSPTYQTYPIRPARPALPITQPPAIEVSERDPEVITLAVKKTFEKMKAENRGLWKKWVAFRDKGVVGEAFVMGEGGKWFTEGHRGVWREIWKRGVCSELWNLPPAPPAPHTLPPNGESLVHPARARYLTALDAHKAWRRTLRCSDPARLNEYEDVWYPHYLLEARHELLDQNPHREVEQDVFRRVEEHFALLQFQLIKSLTVKDEFRFAVQGDGGWVRRKGLGEQIHDVEMAERGVPWDMSFVREENERQDERERGEYAERRWKRQKEKDKDELCQEWLQWYHTLAWMCRGLLDMPVLRYGRGDLNTADVPCLVEAVSRLSVFWDDSYTGAAAEGDVQMAETLPAVPQQMAAALADPFVPTDDALEGSTASPPAQEESVLSGSEDGVAIAPTRRTDSPAQAVAQQSLHTTDAQVRAQSPEHEEFLRRCTRSGVVVTAPRTDSPAQPTVQESDEITPFSHRHWYEEFMDYPMIRRIRIRRIPRDMAPWR